MDPGPILAETSSRRGERSFHLAGCRPVSIVAPEARHINREDRAKGPRGQIKMEWGSSLWGGATTGGGSACCLVADGSSPPVGLEDGLEAEEEAALDLPPLEDDWGVSLDPGLDLDLVWETPLSVEIDWGLPTAMRP